MGIKGFETFIRENPHENIAQDVNIHDAIVEWQRENDMRQPTIIINLVRFVKILAKIDRNSLIVGGQYDIYNKKITKFFEKLREWNAKLVFFCRPFLNDIDEATIANAYNHAVRNSLPEFMLDQMKMGRWSPCHMDKRFLYNLMQICSGYGEVYTHMHGATFNIVQYAREHSDEVLAMIDNDTDFLLFEGEYQYWSLADLDILRFQTKKYCSDVLHDRLKLNTQQIQMLAALSRLKGDCIPNLARDMETTENSGKTIFKLSNYVRGLDNLGALERIAADIFGENYTPQQLKEIQGELIRYQMPEPDNLSGRNQSFRDFVEFSKINLYFVYGLAVETVSTNQALAFIDLRRPDSTEFIQLMTTMLMKQCGIIFKDVEERPHSRTVKIKRTLNVMSPSFANKSDENDEPIIYPPMDLPSLHQIIIQEKDTSFDDTRWFIFRWMLGLDDEFILNVRSKFESNFMRIVSYTLKFLLSNQSISFREADIIFLTELNGHNMATNATNATNQRWQQTNNTRNAPPAAAPGFAPTNHNITPLFISANWRDPNNYILPAQPVAMVNFQGIRRPPLVISNWRDQHDRNDRRPHNWSNYNNRARNTLPTKHDRNFIDLEWIQVAHKYTIAFEAICHCLELCGLRKETDLIRFDALNFHARMRRDKRGDAAIDTMVAKIRNIRLYCR
ncbi:uncharacterized protein LOC129577310 [Sitodiplosis mosellana]|uniref:uncharacterized protein LOC129577310 n=1 Tax=Sitodiplosis mosellana TaxID=263140 RepID=UPI0024447856|nr:uncharacterized protein LOC129577310 [Sitodiplosis mosellana]